MLPCGNNKNGIMGLSLTQVGLLLATGILLSIVLTFVFCNDWHRTAELQNQASSFSHFLFDIDSSFFERRDVFQFSQKEYPYLIVISPESILISAKGSWRSTLIVTQRFLVSPWLRMFELNWTTGDDLHRYLNTTYGHWGTQVDPISSEQFSSLCQEQQNSTMYYTFYPLEITIWEPVWIEKVTIFYSQTESYDFLLLYQASAISI
jgi:hypothetical protein